MSLGDTDVTYAQANFAFDLLREIAKEDDRSSIVFSPASISLALAIVYAGAKNKTEEELRRLLGGRFSAAEIHNHFSSIAKVWSEEQHEGDEDNHSTYDNKGVKLQTANKIYVQDQFKVLDSFEKFINDNYAGAFETVDFGDAVKVVKTVNTFISERTNGKITDLMSIDTINQYTRMIIVNAIYFRGIWCKQFRKENTEMEIFYSKPDSPREIEMMNITDDFFYLEDDELQCLRMGYRSGTVEAYFVLPRKRYCLGTLINQLSGSKFLDKITNHMTEEKVKVKLPKFRVESKHEVDELLYGMDVKEMFSDTKADFSGITGTNDLFVKKIIQKACLEVSFPERS